MSTFFRLRCWCEERGCYVVSLKKWSLRGSVWCSWRGDRSSADRCLGGVLDLCMRNSLLTNSVRLILPGMICKLRREITLCLKLRRYYMLQSQSRYQYMVIVQEKIQKGRNFGPRLVKQIHVLKSRVAKKTVTCPESERGNVGELCINFLLGLDGLHDSAAPIQPRPGRRSDCTSVLGTPKFTIFT